MILKEAQTISLSQVFPDLVTVADRLFPLSSSSRPSIEEYEKALEVSGRLTPPVKYSLEKALRIRPQTRVVVYVAGSLTGADEPTKARYGQVSNMLERYRNEGLDRELFFGYVPHLHGTDPVEHPSVTAEEVRDIDALWASVVADFHVNFVWPLAQGNAIEEGWAEKSMIPAVYLNPKGNRLSRLTRGMNNVAQTIEYDDFQTDGLAQLGGFFDELAAWLQTFPERDPREFFYMSYRVLREPALRARGIATNSFNPVFPVEDCVIYISDPEHPRQGQVGQLVAHDWRDYGNLFVQFGEETEVIPDSTRGISYWSK